MSSMYSLPRRDEDLHDLENIPLTNFNQPPQNQPPEYQVPQKQTAEHEETKKCKTYKCTIHGLFVLLSLTFIPIIVLGVLYGKSNETPQTPENSTVCTSIVTTTTSIPGKAQQAPKPRPQ